MKTNGKYDEYYEARDIVKNIIAKDLFGPVFINETIIEPPMQYYIMGKLHPSILSEKENNKLEEVTVQKESGVEETNNLMLALTNMKNPSSMGITCTLKPNVKSIKVNIEFGLYEGLDENEAKEKGLNLERYKDELNKDTIYWNRTPFEFEKEINVVSSKETEVELMSGIYLRGYVPKICKGGERIFTLVLINKRTSKKDWISVSAKMVFQAYLKISSIIDGNKIFTTSMRQVELKEDEELLELEMLYSNYKCYGQGHGCSINWGNKLLIENEEPDYVESTFIPEYNLKQMKAAQMEFAPVLSMDYIVNSKPEIVIEKLRAFAEVYQEWILEKGKEVKEVDERVKSCAISNLEKCNNSYLRILNAIMFLEKSLEGNKLAWEAFIYANEAMLNQRIQGIKKQNKGDEVEIDKTKIKWYSFQLAFFLQELPSIINPSGEDRKLVDLLWFPTGGGKTEAYLGIAAFIIFYRRMKDIEQGEGVSVIMRYTLRLLTIQQFERASTLICACELLRLKYNISDNPIEIGLWVGNGLTPKDVMEARRTLKSMKKGVGLANGKADPCQVKVCPWCGEELTIEDYSADEKRMYIHCNNSSCEFSKDRSLPILLTDEEIYNYTPAFLLATIDKFAQITIKSEPTTIFGVDSIHNPPDLIIQDELHLISGPLGTMTGIYEAAITKICENDGIPIKIIASTATIRNAENQIKALYGRAYAQFPPQGISADDSFFAVKSSIEESPARLYLGYIGIGTTLTTSMIRLYAAWLFASRYLVAKGYSDKVIDNFWTMTGYFNSLRELGSARTQVEDNVQSRYQYLKDQKFSYLIPKFSGEENYTLTAELTSRMKNDEISELIQKGLKKGFTRKNSNDVYDFILASNMISVGVDVGRLGTMAVMQQPKTNAEYIQATSRVGRDNPGIVFTLFNAYSSRDRSHYEQFKRYHSALYRYVEATSLTPFSDRARDRGLQALFVTLSRYLVSNLRKNTDARNFDKDSLEIAKIERLILDYVAKVDVRELDNVREELKEIKEVWQAQVSGDLVYQNRGSKNKKSKPLLKLDTDKDDRFRTMNSMRNVEQQSGVYLLGR